jgi:hypothetical protein
MIRLRKSDGEIMEIPAGLFVEICSLDGLVAKLTFQDDNGHIQEVKAGDPEAEHYTRLFPSVKFAKIIEL